MRPLSLLALGALVAGPALAEPVQTEAALVSAFAAHDCMLAPDEVAGYLGPLGFTPDFTRETLSGWIVDGTAWEDHLRRLSLPASVCPPLDAAPTPRDALIQRAAGSDCTIRQDDLAGIEQDLGLGEAQLRAILGPMVDDGSAELGLSSVTLGEGVCPPETEASR